MEHFSAPHNVTVSVNIFVALIHLFMAYFYLDFVVKFIQIISTLYNKLCK